MKYLSYCCSLCLFLAVLKLPIEYYTFLRWLVFTTSVLVVINLSNTQWIWKGVFGVIAGLFNPIVPIYLYNKGFWIPIDIISGVLFLWLEFLKKQKKQPKKATEKEEEIHKSEEKLVRDVIQK